VPPAGQARAARQHPAQGDRRATDDQQRRCCEHEEDVLNHVRREERAARGVERRHKGYDQSKQATGEGGDAPQGNTPARAGPLP